MRLIVVVSVGVLTVAHLSLRSADAFHHTSTYVSIPQHTSAYLSIRQHTSAYVSIRVHTSAYVSIRQHTSAYVSIRVHTSAYVSIRQHTSHTSAYVKAWRTKSAQPEVRRRISWMAVFLEKATLATGPACLTSAVKSCTCSHEELACCVVVKIDTAPS